MSNGILPDGIEFDGQVFWSICPDCGWEQGDLGRNVSCDECGYGPMPTMDMPTMDTGPQVLNNAEVTEI